MLTCSTAS